MVSPTSSMRAGMSSPAGKMSMTPPRMQNSPCSSTGSWCVNPASTRVPAICRVSISSPGAMSSDSAMTASGGLTRGRSATADATTTRASPEAMVCRARARAEAMRRCGARPRYGSTSCDGNGTTLCSRASAEAPSSPPRKKRTSLVTCSTSRSEGTTASTSSLRGSSEAAPAIQKAFAAGVRPDVARTRAPRSSSWSFRDGTVFQVYISSSGVSRRSPGAAVTPARVRRQPGRRRRATTVRRRPPGRRESRRAQGAAAGAGARSARCTRGGSDAGPSAD